MNHTPTPYMIASDTDPITIIRQERGCWYGEVIAHCGSVKIPANHRHAAFIVRACNAHDELVKTLKRVEANLTVDTATRFGIYKALKFAYGE